MSKFEIIVQRGHEAERVTTAFYRFLELKAVSSDEVASIQTEILGNAERRTVQLWSDEAVCDFERFLKGFHVEPPSGLARPWSAKTLRR